MDDLRESPATEVVHLLQSEGARIIAWEPFKPDANLNNIEMGSSLENTINNSDGILLLVKHSEFIGLQPEKIANLTKSRIIVDAVNAWNIEEWQKAGFQFHRLGDSKSKSVK